MDCKRCGGSMMPETVIKLRRGLFGFRETRAQGAYCATCKTGVLVEKPALGRGPAHTDCPLFSSNHPTIPPMWRHLGVTRSGGINTGAMTSGDHLSVRS